MVDCLTHADGVGGRGEWGVRRRGGGSVGGAKRPKRGKSPKVVSYSRVNFGSYRSL